MFIEVRLRRRHTRSLPGFPCQSKTEHAAARGSSRSAVVTLMPLRPAQQPSAESPDGQVQAGRLLLDRHQLVGPFFGELPVRLPIEKLALSSQVLNYQQLVWERANARPSNHLGRPVLIERSAAGPLA